MDSSTCATGNMVIPCRYCQGQATAPTTTRCPNTDLHVRQPAAGTDPRTPGASIKWANSEGLLAFVAMAGAKDAPLAHVQCAPSPGRDSRWRAGSPLPAGKPTCPNSHGSAQGAAHCDPLARSACFLARMRANFAFFRSFNSPLGHMWQWQHSAPWTHPSGFQNHPQGLHLPVPWRSAPAEACGCRIVLGRLGGGLGGSAERPSCTEPFSDDGAVRLSPSDVLPQDKDAEPCRLTPTHQLLQAATARPSIWSSSSKNPSMNVFFTFTS
mmetsp:Transcript_65870/g.183708  ORF Transcript_65870/g.183708 Transcript_65870/m.183708 type:complete len:268 (-) Transcript_65870:342-1145(-)